jgi:cytochrome c oxidase cbb3-type subunit 3
MMPAFGEQGLLNSQELDDVTTYVMSLSEDTSDPEAAARGEELFATQCASCHGNDGRGNRAFGAPNLADAEWLYGDSRRAIRMQIYAPRHGMMPFWNERLDQATITALAIYVHSLGGGEPEPTETSDAGGETIVGSLETLREEAEKR